MREKRMAKAIDKKDCWIQEEFIEAINNNTKAMQQLNSRPCLSGVKNDG